MAGGTSHQTIRLAPGRHKSPADGACVMELASMLAGERFTDHPRCVDPVIAAYLRALNDRLPAARRQDLRPYAAAVVGTRGSQRVRRARRRACLRFASGRERGGRVRLALFVGLRLSSGAPDWAAREAVAREDGFAAGFALLDELLRLGGSALPGEGTRVGERLEPPPLPLPVAPAPQVRVPAGAAELVVEPQVADR